MESFRFTKIFHTGISDVDDQHRKLVELINIFGESLTSIKNDNQNLDTVFSELAHYARYHFKTEEALMRKLKIDHRHYDLHVEQHQNFIDDVTGMHVDTDGDQLKASGQLFEFLTHWLAYHILGSDQNMARQVEALRAGQSPEEAYAGMELKCDPATKPLLLAINSLFQLVSDRNKDLRLLNQSLEQKVKERTRELFEANKRLVEISLTDALTRLPNRRHAIQQLKKHWEDSTLSGLPITLMMIDADHFKAVNDTYGHDAGDRVLCEVSNELRHSVRTDDLVCRLGGDEFVIICPATNASGGLHIAEIVRENVSRMQVPTGDGFWHGSVSIGVACRTEGMNDFEALIKAADDAVYNAKRAGKNCVRTPSVS